MEIIMYPASLVSRIPRDMTYFHQGQTMQRIVSTTTGASPRSNQTMQPTATRCTLTFPDDKHFHFDHRSLSVAAADLVLVRRMATRTRDKWILLGVVIATFCIMVYLDSIVLA